MHSHPIILQPQSFIAFTHLYSFRPHHCTMHPLPKHRSILQLHSEHHARGTSTHLHYLQHKITIRSCTAQLAPYDARSHQSHKSVTAADVSSQHLTSQHSHIASTALMTSSLHHSASFHFTKTSTFTRSHSRTMHVETTMISQTN